MTEKPTKESVSIVIPARMGSNRIPLKNLRLLNGVPLIQHAIDVAKESNIAKNIFLNSDGDLFKSVAVNNEIDFYKRAPDLATSESLIDDYLNDFMLNVDTDYLVLLNPTSPFFEVDGLLRAWAQFLRSGVDTLLSCEKVQTHCFMNGKAINFSIDQKHPRSQDLVPVRALNFAVTIWKTATFKASYAQFGHGVYSGNIGFFDTENWENIDVDYEVDFQLAEQVSRFLGEKTEISATYPTYVEEYLREVPDPRN